MEYKYKVVKQPQVKYDGADMELVGYAYDEITLWNMVEKLQAEKIEFNIICTPTKKNI